MQKITMELKVEGISAIKLYRELSRKEYSKGILVRPAAFTVIFDKPEDLVRFAAFMQNEYNK